jgi:hypothetical protein
MEVVWLKRLFAAPSSPASFPSSARHILTPSLHASIVIFSAVSRIGLSNMSHAAVTPPLKTITSGFRMCIIFETATPR